MLSYSNDISFDKNKFKKKTNPNVIAINLQKLFNIFLFAILKNCVLRLKVFFLIAIDIFSCYLVVFGFDDSSFIKNLFLLISENPVQN